MSHELRTPLNAIIRFTGTLLMELPGPVNEEQTEQLRTVQVNSKHLLSLINDPLDVARIESGKFELRPEAVECGALVKELLVGIADAGHRDGASISFHSEFGHGSTFTLELRG